MLPCLGGGGGGGTAAAAPTLLAGFSPSVDHEPRPWAAAVGVSMSGDSSRDLIREPTPNHGLRQRTCSVADQLQHITRTCETCKG